MKKLLFIFLLLIATPCFGATVTWQGDESANWSVGGNWDTGSKPTAADDVVLSNAAACTINENAVCRSFNASSYTGTLTHNASVSLTIGDATAGAGNVALAFNSTANMTYTLGNATTSSISFISTSATVQTVNFNGHNTGNVTFNAASNGSWQLTGAWGTSAVNTSQVTTLTKGTLDTNGQACFWGGFNSNGSLTRTLTLGNSVIDTYNTSTAWNSNVTTNLTITANTATFNVNGNAATFSSFTFDFNGLTLNYLGGNGTINISGGTMDNINFTGTAVKTCVFTISNPLIVPGTFNIDGNSSINRVLVASNTLGTARTLTLTGATVSGCSNVDFRDITFAGSPDFSSITGGAGDCGGNTGGTLTTADDWYWNGSGTRNFSDYTYWYTATNGGGDQMASTRCPLPQDTCYFDADSIDGATTVDQDLPRIPGIDFTGVDAMNFHANNLSQVCYGSIKLVSNVTLSTSSSYLFSFSGRSSTNTIDSGGKTFPPTYISSASGTYTLTANFSTNTGDSDFSVVTGVFDADIYNVTARAINLSGTGSRTILMGSGNWTCYSDGNPRSWDNETTTNETLTPGESTIILAYVSTLNPIFRGGGKAYNNLSITGSGSGTPIFQGSNTFNTLTINAPKTVKFTAGTDQLVTSFVATGDAGNLIHLDSTSASAATLSDTTGTNTVHYCHIGETGPVNAEGGATWDATDNCEVNTSTGWTTAAGGATTSLPQNTLGNGIGQGIGRGMR